MKNKDIHNGFDDKLVRDTLGNILLEADREGLGHSSDYLKHQIAQLQEELKLSEQREAARILIEKLGWHEHDVSDEVEDYHYENYFSFIGTWEEYAELIKEMKGENK